MNCKFCNEPLTSAELVDGHSCPEPEGLRALSCSAHLADDITVGQLVRFLDRVHMAAANREKPDQDMMRSMQKLAGEVDSALELYRISRPHPTGQEPEGFADPDC